jgi:hypothetical protein
MVTAHHGDRLAFGQAVAGEAAGQRVAAPLEVGEREGSLVVDDRRGGGEACGAADDPAASVGPKRRRPTSARTARSGRDGRISPARASVPATWMPSEIATAIAGIQSRSSFDRISGC